MDEIELKDLVIKASEKFRIDANLIRAIIEVESSCNPEATRYEPHWTYFNNVQAYSEKLCIPRSEEEENQMTSWGLMQVMGAVARDLGFSDHLEMLTHPDIGIFYGCKKLRQLFDRYGLEEDVVSSYNEGSPRKTMAGMYSNQRYVDKVYQKLGIYRKLI